MSEERPGNPAAAVPPPSTSALSRLSDKAAAFLGLLPALLAGLLVLRAAELLSGLEPGTGAAQAAGTWLAAAALDIYSLARHLPLIFLVSLPLLPRPGRRPAALGLLWSLLLLVQLSLTQYFFLSGVPLGSDLFAYTLEDIARTVRGAGDLSPAIFAAAALGLGALWAALLAAPRRLPVFAPRTALAALGAGLALLVLAPRQPGTIRGLSEHGRGLAVNKTAYFVDEALAYLSPVKKAPPKTEASSGMDLGRLDPAYPFLREERTYDSLGPFFKPGGPPPNLVFLIAEGLGRGFSGPGAVFGSFTPKLDRLAEEGLYWENFLAVQGRTFGVLPAVFGSLPFGRNGLAELGLKMPPHITLLSVLKRHGYRVRAYVGFNADFDNDRHFYALNGADSLVDELNFGPGYRKSTSWGYADRDLFSRALAGEAADPRGPSVTVIKTSTMHTPYKFNGQEAYYPVFERRLDELGIPENRKAAYRRHRDIYTCVLYFDDEVSRLIAELKKRPSWKNTVFVLTGDHRLPEIPMSTRLSRYYVPLVIFSPKLKAPARFKAVSSHFDIAPSLLALLANGYGLKTPRRVTWIGSGLDTTPDFRSVQTLPLMQTKTDLVDFISGGWYLNQGVVYKIGDSMQITRSDDKEALRVMTEKFAAFKAANEVVARTNKVMPEGAAEDLAPYVKEERLKLPDAVNDSLAPGLAVREVRAPESARAGALAIEVTFACPGREPSPVFVPLVVLMTPENRELRETYGRPQQLKPDASVTLRLDIKSDVPPGRYFLAVIPSHPDTGKAVGGGKYRVPVLLTGGSK